MIQDEKVLLLDCGGQNAQLIARMVRDCGVYCHVKRTFIPENAQEYRGVLLTRKPENFTQVEASDLPLLDISEVGYAPETLKQFLYDRCLCSGTWEMNAFVRESIAEIQKQVDGKKVLCALSGGVDSAVCAVLVHQAIGKKLTCIFVNHGLMRKEEPEMVERVFKEKYDINLICVDAVDRFLGRLEGVAEPEKKRKIIGEEFIRVFEEEAQKLGKVEYLCQGTIYPDILESGIGGAAVKAHHNVGGLPETIGFDGLIEPLKDLFKDEVRRVGQALGLPDNMVNRQPFPGPGLGVRVVGAITREKLHLVREADAILREEIEKAGLGKEINQYFAVLPGVQSVGVRGGRVVEDMIALRAVVTKDFMTADFARIPYEVLAKISSRIVQEVPGVNRVVYDITGKPPATIEWE